MKEILFRGKRIDNGEWVQGDFCGPCNIVFIENGYDPVLGKGDSPMCNDYEVIPETVGQYTGWTDKNGKRIFEGDIVELTDVNNDIKWNAIVVFGNPYGKYCWGWNLMYVGANPKVNTDILCWVDMEDSGAFIEVIGNIHDNPELLRGE